MDFFNLAFISSVEAETSSTAAVFSSEIEAIFSISCKISVDPAAICSVEAVFSSTTALTVVTASTRS